jgi:glucokinase
MSCFLVIGDLGGTNIRLDIVDATVPACLPRDRDAPHSTRLLTRDFASFEDALRSFTAELPAKIADSLCGAAFAVCGPVVDGRAACLAPSMGPNGWSPTSASVAEALGLPLGAAHLVNDFVAVGLALPTALRAAGGDLVELYAPPAPFVRAATTPGSTVAVLGPGTGLGECFGVRQESGDLAVFPSEGGMAEFSPRTEEEWALRAWIAAQQEPSLTQVEIEKVCSGEGLRNVYGYLLSTGSSVEPVEPVEPTIGRSSSPAAIVERSRAGDELCERALGLWLAALGSEAANLAVRFQARGGVYIAGGGICSKLAPEIADGRLRAAYLRSPRLLPIHAHCPLYLLPADGDDLGLDGALAFARTKLPAAPDPARALSVQDCDVCRLPTAEDAAARVAELVLAALCATPDLVLCVASGATPTRCYAMLAAEAERAPERFARLRVVQVRGID